MKVVHTSLQQRALAAVVLLGFGTAGLAAGLGASSYLKEKRRVAIAEAAEAQAERNAEAEAERKQTVEREQEASAAKVAEQARRAEREARNQRIEDEETAQEEREKHLPCEGGHCVTIAIMDASVASISSKDENGYEQKHSPDLERMTVAVGGKSPGDGLSVAGQTFEGHGATADLLCLENCFILQVGTIHHTGIGAYKTHWTPCYSQYGSCSDYQNLPYLSIGEAKWQILELCVRPGYCRAMSTVNARE